MKPDMLTLYTYFRSSAAYRVRIALHLKGLDWQSVPIHLLKDGGQQRSTAYLARNPQGLVPALALADGTTLTQSLAIMEYLDEAYPHTPALLPTDIVGRAQVRALAQTIACDIHPLNNLRVLNYLTQQLGVSDADKATWYKHWMAAGLTALEAMLVQSDATGQFCHGNQPTLADCCLIPQLYNARRFQCPLDAYPTLLRIESHCLTLPAFVQAAPEQQPDAA